MLYRLLGMLTWKIARRVARRKLSSAPVGPRPILLGGVAAAIVAGWVRQRGQGRPAGA